MDSSFFYEFGPARFAYFFIIEGTMLTSVAAAISSFQVIFLREYRISLFVIIKVFTFNQLFHP